MNEINFLPQSLLDEYARRRRVTRQVMLTVLMVCSLFGGHLYANAQLTSLEAYASHLTEQSNAARDRLEEMARLECEYHTLANHARVRKQLAAPVRASQVLGCIAQAMPDGIAMTGVSLRAPTPNPNADKGEAAPAATKHPAVGDLRQPVIDVQIDGLASDDLVIAELIGTLSDHPLFKSVNLPYTKEVSYDTFVARRFRVDARVRLDRPVVTTTAVQEQSP